MRLLANGLAQGVLAVYFAWLVMRLFDQMAAPTGSAGLLFAALALTVLLSAWLRRDERVQAEMLGQHYVASVRQRLYRRLLSSSSRELRVRRKGALLLKFVGDLSALRRWVSLGFARLLVAGLAVSVALGAITWVHWPFALGVASLLSIAALWIVRQGAGLRAAVAETRRRQARLAANVTEKMNHLATVQVFGQSGREQRLMRRQSDRLIDAAIRKAEKIGTLRAVVDTTAGASVLVILTLAFLSSPDQSSPALVAAAISIMGFLTPPLRDLGRVQEYWLSAQVARENVLRVSEITTRVRERRSGPSLAMSAGAIEFRNVSVRGALRRFSAKTAGGRVIAVMGGNGSGKSTLLGLVGRLYDPDKGKVFIDGQDISRVRLSSLRKQAAYISADVPLVSGSLRKNLCYGVGRVESERLRQVIGSCELDDLVNRLRGGLEARLAEGGASLSQGERVRVALARALLCRPAILLLDEADANLDEQARRALDRIISNFSGTVLMASHRRSVLRNCDAIWELRDGRLERCTDIEADANIVPICGAERGTPVPNENAGRVCP